MASERPPAVVYSLTEIASFAVGVTLTIASSLVVTGRAPVMLALMRNDALSERAQALILRYLLRALLGASRTLTRPDVQPELDALMDELSALALES